MKWLKSEFVIQPTQWPCLQVGNKQMPNYLPVEVCKIDILPDNNGSLYGDLKRICETDLGLVSQCCFTKHVFRMSKQYFADIYMALKINAKLLVDALRFLEEWSRNYSYLSESNMGRNQNIIYSLQGWCEYSRRMSREWCSTVRLAGSNNNLYLSCENKQTNNTL